MNWDAWLGPNTIARPYNSVLLPTPNDTFWGQWRGIDEFGGGGMTDWGAHMFDIAQWSLDMDESGPVEIVPPTRSDGSRSDVSGNSGKGLVYRYTNGVEMRHQPVEGRQFCQFIGTEGEIKVARGELTTTPTALKDKVIENDSRNVYFSDNHYKDFLDTIQSRKTPICDVEVGHRTATVCTIGNIAYQLRRPLRWNPVREKFENDAEANKLLSRPMRKEWSV